MMVKLKEIFKGDMGEKCHILPLAGMTDSGIKMIKWVGKLLEILVENDGRS